MSRGKKTIWITIASVVVLSIVIATYRTRRAQQNSGVKYETAKVDRGDVIAKVTATGTLSALITVQVGAQVSGRISQLMVDFNSPVKKGQVLAKIDPQLLAAASAQAQANFIAAQSNLTRAKVQAKEAERTYQRTKNLSERKLIAQAELDTAQTNAEVAQAQVAAAAGSLAQARAMLHQADVNLGYTTILSPIDGIVISRNIDVGQTVAASFQAPTLFVLAEDLRKMQVNTSVAEADVGKLQPKMRASFVVDAFVGEQFWGVIRQIRNAPQTLQNVVTYDAVIDVPNPALKLRPGMTANVTFVYAEKRNVIRVPNAAMRFLPNAELLAQMQGGPADGSAASRSQLNRTVPKPKLGQRIVWRLRHDRATPVIITPGVSDGSVTELVQGDLGPGDVLVIDATGDSPRRGFRLFAR